MDARGQGTVHAQTLGQEGFLEARRLNAPQKNPVRPQTAGRQLEMYRSLGIESRGNLRNVHSENTDVLGSRCAENEPAHEQEDSNEELTRE